MRTKINLSGIVAMTVLAVALVALLGGCSSSDDNGVVVPAGGTVAGFVIAATENMGIGNVQVIIQRVRVSGGVVVGYDDVATALSRTPDGAFEIRNVPAGNYQRLRVVPNRELWPELTIDYPITVVDDGTVNLPRILVFDDLPPSPAGG